MMSNFYNKHKSIIKKSVHFIILSLVLLLINNNIINSFIFATNDIKVCRNIASNNHGNSQTISTGLDRIDGEFIGSLHSTIDLDVAIMDTGIDHNHEDLNVYKEIDLTGLNNTDDQCGHGTHIAGIIGAKNNELGVLGVAPGVRLWDIKISTCDKPNEDPVATEKSFLDGLKYVIDNSDEIDVLNISQNQPCPETPEGACNPDTYKKEIDRIVNSGIVVVTSAGNNKDHASDYIPPRLSNVITVSSISDTDGKCGGLGPMSSVGEADDVFDSKSNMGEAIDIAAPGIDIFSTLPNNDYGNMSGTSMAAPFVSGAVALIKYLQPSINNNEIYNILRNSGSNSETLCDGQGKGYFKHDVDIFSEPLLYIKDIVKEVVSRN